MTMDVGKIGLTPRSAQCQQLANGEEREGDGGGSRERRGREIGPAQERVGERGRTRGRQGGRDGAAGGVDHCGEGEGRWWPALGTEGREGRAVRRGRGGREELVAAAA